MIWEQSRTGHAVHYRCGERLLRALEDPLAEAWVIWEDTVRYLIQGGCSHVPEANSPGHASHTQHAIWSVSFWGRLLPFSLEKLSSSKFLGSAHFAQFKRRTRPLNHFLKIYTCTCEPRWLPEVDRAMVGTNCARC